MPEKSIVEIPRPLRDMYDKGKQALQRSNLDYAILHFEQVLQKEPGFYECREALRAAQYRKAGASTGFFKKMISGASSKPLVAKGQMLMRKNPLEALIVAEQILTSDPSSEDGHRLLAEAALAADLPKTAVLSLEIVVKNAPKDRGLRLNLATAYAKTNQAAQAEAIYTDLLKANANDPEVMQAYKNLTARRTLNESGYEALADGSGSYRDVLKDKAESVSMEQENRTVKSDDVAAKLIEEYHERLRTEPNNLKLLRNLAEMHVQRKEYDQALEFYNRINSAEGASDPSLEKAIAETTLRRYDLVQSQLDPNAPDYTEQVNKLQTERIAYQLDECRQRAEKYPTDLVIRFELGQLFLQAGKIGEAIQEFQKAQNNPQKRLQAMGFLAQCFSRRNMNDMAARKLQEALKEKVGFDDEKKDLIYMLGCVLEKMGKREEAIDQFKIIYEADIAYKDVGTKVDAYYAEKGM